MMHPACVSLLSILVAAALAPDDQNPQSQESLTRVLDSQNSSQSTTAPDALPSVDDFAWLAGHWRGEGLGGVCEEVWSQPLAGTMMGSFRLVVDGEIQFYELMVLGPDAEGVALKVKHFSKDFVAWEEKEDAVRFASESVKPNEAKFSGLTMNRDGDNLDLRLRMRSGLTTRWEPFALKRVSPNDG